MPPPERQEERIRLIREYPEGAISLRFYECEGKQFWRLVRDTPKGPVRIAVGRSSEIAALGKVFAKAGRSQEMSRERPGTERGETLRRGGEGHLRSWWSAV